MGLSPIKRITIVTPVHNDWESLAALIDDLALQLVGTRYEVDILAVDDGSVEPHPPYLRRKQGLITTVKVVRLAVNLGHQRAIAVGIYEASRMPVDAIVVMDADGEDRPIDVRTMLDHSNAYPTHIVVARRTKRSEGWIFRTSYSLYKILFYAATGHVIQHGNFCIIPQVRVNSVLHTSHTWNNLAASIARSKIPYTGVSTVRGRRYFGRSTMKFSGLVLHGLSAISVYMDVLTVRVLFTCATLCGLILIAAMALLFIKFSTTLAIPGWTTTTLGLLTIIALQLLFLTATTLFGHLSARNQAVAIPFAIAPLYISSIEILSNLDRKETENDR